MAIIINAAWKSKKPDEEVEFKGETYTIGYDAFATIEAAVEKGNTSEFVIVDKKLSAPVKNPETKIFEDITGAATDIFASTDTGDVESNDKKTTTRTVKFAAAAGGTATIKEQADDIELNGFDKITATKVGGTFFGGKQDASLSTKVFDDEDKVQESEDITATYTSTATGSLSVTGDANVPADVTVGGIQDSESGLDDVIKNISDIYTVAATEPGEEPAEYDAPIAASYASVTLTNVMSNSAFNGGSVSEKATLKASSAEDASGLVKSSEDYSYSYTGKVGSGTATLTDAGSGALIGFKSTKLTVKNADGITVGEIAGGSHNESYTLKKAYQEEVSASNNWSRTKVTTVAGDLTATGKEGKLVNIAGIKMESSVNLKYANVEDEIELGQENLKEAENISVKAQKEDYALTWDSSENSSETVGGTLKAENSNIAGYIEGVKDLTVTNSVFGDAYAWNKQEIESNKTTGFSAAGVTDDISLADVDWDMSFSDTSSEKETYTASGTATLTDAVGGTLGGFKTVKITAKKNPASAVGSLYSVNSSEEDSSKQVYDVDKSSSYDISSKDVYTAAGTLTATGTKDIAAVTGGVNGFNSIKLQYANAGIINGGNISDTSSDKYALAVKSDDTVSYSYSHSEEQVNTAEGSLDASSKSNLVGINNIKAVSITDSFFTNAAAGNHKHTQTSTETGYTAELVANASAAGLDFEQAYTTQWSDKVEDSNGGTSFKFAGKTQNQTEAGVSGYKSVSLENKNSTEDQRLIVTLQNNVMTTENSDKESFDPDKSYSHTGKEVTTGKAEGDATIKGYTTANVLGFASVKATGSKQNGGIYDTALIGFDSSSTYTNSSEGTTTVTADKEGNRLGDYKGKTSNNRKITATLDATKAEISGIYSQLKTVKLTNVNVTNAAFGNERDYDFSRTTNIKWNADDLQEIAPVEAVLDWNNEAAIAKLTSADYSITGKWTAVGDFTLKNDKNSDLAGLSISNFKNVDITAVTPEQTVVNTLSIQGDESEKKTFKYTATETKQTLDYSETETETSVGALKVSGKSATDAVTELSVGDSGFAGMGFASITLKDAVISGAGAVANAYAESGSYTISESVSEDGSASVKVTTAYSKAGNGKFTASVAKPVADQPVMVFEGTLNGYGTISLSNVSIGDVDNFKTVGAGDYVVPFDSDSYFDVYAFNNDPGELPDGAQTLSGNISGSWTVDKDGQVNSSWTATSATTASGSFTQTAKTAGAEAGEINGYDKVELTGVAAVNGAINGENTENSTVLILKTVKGEVVTNSRIDTVQKTSSASVKLTGKKIGVAMQSVQAGNVTKYKSVTLDNAEVGTVSAGSSKVVTTQDYLNGTVTIATTQAADGTLTASSSQIGGNAEGFQTVKLTNTAAAVDFDGKYLSNVLSTDLGVTYLEAKSTGSFTASYNGKTAAETPYAVGELTGYQEVKLTDYSAEDVTAGNKSFLLTPEDEEKDIPATRQDSFTTKGSSFSATAKTDAAMTVGDIDGFAKVEATGLVSVGSVTNAGIDSDQVVFEGRVYSGAHYGDYAFTANLDDITAPDAMEFTSISADASAASVKISGKAATKAAPVAVPTAVTGDITGYGSVILSNVTLGSEGEVLYAGGKYEYSAKTNKDDEVIATSTSTATGKLSISSATAVAGAVFAVEGFQTVDIKIDGDTAATFQDIIGGTETAQFTDGDLDYNTYAVAGKLTLANASVQGTVAGFATVNFTNAAITGEGEEGAHILGYEISAKFDKENEEWVPTSTGKSVVTFDNTIEATTEIGGSIIAAKSIEFRTSKVDDTDDFTVTSAIDSGDDYEGNNIKIMFNKCQATADLSKFDLNAGDVVELKSGAVLTLGGQIESLAEYFTAMGGSQFKGDGFIASAYEEADVRAALEDKEIEVGKSIGFITIQ